jgi:hypothetical protein
MPFGGHGALDDLRFLFTTLVFDIPLQDVRQLVAQNRRARGRRFIQTGVVAQDVFAS